jgi:hypothetical protein
LSKTRKHLRAVEVPLFVEAHAMAQRDAGGTTPTVSQLIRRMPPSLREWAASPLSVTRAAVRLQLPLIDDSTKRMKGIDYALLPAVVRAHSLAKPDEGPPTAEGVLSGVRAAGHEVDLDTVKAACRKLHLPIVNARAEARAAKAERAAQSQTSELLEDAIRRLVDAAEALEHAAVIITGRGKR